MKKLWLVTALAMTACSKGAGGGVDDGPASIEVPNLEVSDKPEDIAKGEATFVAKGCDACHKIGGGKLVGPDLQGVTSRRSVKWIEKMILKPDVMLQEDPVAKQLLAAHMTAMANQNVSATDELPFILAYLKAHEH